MSDPKALSIIWANVDKTYFQRHPQRRTHIRNAYKDEMRGEFWSLGEHDSNRRRILLCRVDNEGNFLPDNKVLKIPFLAFADETIEDDDARKRIDIGISRGR